MIGDDGTCTALDVALLQLNSIVDALGEFIISISTVLSSEQSSESECAVAGSLIETDTQSSRPLKKPCLGYLIQIETQQID